MVQAAGGDAAHPGSTPLDFETAAADAAGGTSASKPRVVAGEHEWVMTCAQDDTSLNVFPPGLRLLLHERGAVGQTLDTLQEISGQGR